MVLAVCRSINTADECVRLPCDAGNHAGRQGTSRLRGLVDSHELARMFAWMRPNDLIWNWVNNYLLGNQPPAFDILLECRYDRLPGPSWRLS
jgi:polyhydroxyalkanoate synthase